MIDIQKVYEYWYNELIDPKVGDKEYPGILARAYSKLHGQPNTELAKIKIKEIYDGLYKDPYFLLRLINETKELKFKSESDRLLYIKLFGDKKLGRCK